MSCHLARRRAARSGLGPDSDGGRAPARAGDAAGRRPGAALDQLARSWTPSAAGSGPTGVHRDEPAFDPRGYWRGSAWPQIDLPALGGGPRRPAVRRGREPGHVGGRGCPSLGLRRALGPRRRDRPGRHPPVLDRRWRSSSTISVRRRGRRSCSTEVADGRRPPHDQPARAAQRPVGTVLTGLRERLAAAKERRRRCGSSCSPAPATRRSARAPTSRGMAGRRRLRRRARRPGRAGPRCSATCGSSGKPTIARVRGYALAGGLRPGAGVRPRGRGRRRPVRHARDQRRAVAVHDHRPARAVDAAEEGARADDDRPPGRRPTRPSASASSTGSCRSTSSTPPSTSWPPTLASKSPAIDEARARLLLRGVGPGGRGRAAAAAPAADDHHRRPRTPPRASPPSPRSATPSGRAGEP